MDNPLADLDEYLAAEPLDEEAPVEGEHDAERLLRRLALVARDRQRIVDAAAEWHRRIDHWQIDRLTPLDRTAEWVERALEGWTRSMVPDGAKSRSISLPSGRVGLRKASLRLDVVDREDAVRWVQEAGLEELLLPAKPREVDRTAAKKAWSVGAEVGRDGEEVAYQLLDADGEVVPGVVGRMAASGQTFTLTLTSGADDV